ncbi:Phage integrase family protein [compost metagenome]
MAEKKTGAAKHSADYRGRKKAEAERFGIETLPVEMASGTRAGMAEAMKAHGYTQLQELLQNLHRSFLACDREEQARRLNTRYERDVIPAKMPRTQKDNLLSLKQLRAAFSEAPIDAITPQVLAQYRDKRSGKVRANREIALLSHIYNMAREWGITEKENPAAGVRKNKERPRDFYAGPEVWNVVYGCAVPELREAMDLAYLTGQRPADVLSMRAADCIEGYLQVSQGKTAKKLRIELNTDNRANQLGLLIEHLMTQRKERGIRNPFLITTEDGRNVTASMLRLRFDDARKAAAARALENQDRVLAEKIQQFQFRDIRPKAASEIGDLTHASRLLGHTDKRITDTVYRRLGEVVKPTR